MHGGVSWLRGGSGSLSILGSELLRGVSPRARMGGTTEEGTSAERQGAATAAEQGAEADRSGAGPSRVPAVQAQEAASNVSEGTLVRGDDLLSRVCRLLWYRENRQYGLGSVRPCCSLPAVRLSVVRPCPVKWYGFARLVPRRVIMQI